MIVLLSIMGYGDSLITLSLLERAGAAAAPLHVVGSGITEKVNGLLQRPVRIAETLFNDAAAFYVVRERGLTAAVADLRRFRSWARRYGSGDTLIFEKEAPLRHRLMAPAGCTVLSARRMAPVYADRARLLQPWLGEQTWPACAVPEGRARRLLINPSARHRARFLSAELLEDTLRECAAAGTEVVLVDVDRRYAALRPQVRSYLGGAPLADAAAALRESDRYLGPDSFFMHLAYYYRKAQLALFHRHHTVFAPPGLFESRSHLFFDQAAGAPLRAAVRRLLGSSA